MDDGAHMVAVVPFHTYGVHHLRITHADDGIAYLRTDAMTCDLLDIAHLTAIGGLIREGVAQGGSDGMGGFFRGTINTFLRRTMTRRRCSGVEDGIYRRFRS